MIEDATREDLVKGIERLKKIRDKYIDENHALWKGIRRLKKSRNKWREQATDQELDRSMNKFMLALYKNSRVEISEELYDIYCAVNNGEITADDAVNTFLKNLIQNIRAEEAVLKNARNEYCALRDIVRSHKLHGSVDIDFLRAVNDACKNVYYILATSQVKERNRKLYKHCKTKWIDRGVYRSSLLDGLLDQEDNFKLPLLIGVFKDTKEGENK